MYCYKKITEDLTWVGGNNRRLAMFEGVYAVPDGVSYNSYLLTEIPPLKKEHVLSLFSKKTNVTL
jgi:hypothetical protein